MKWIAAFCLIALLAGCGDDDSIENPVPSDGVADLNFRNRPYSFKSLQLLSPADTSIKKMGIDIIGILDQKDTMGLLFKNLDRELKEINRYTLKNHNILGSLIDGDVIYGDYDLIEGDSFEDFLSLDSITDKQLYYSLQLNVVDSVFNEVPDTLWISGTMRVNRP